MATFYLPVGSKLLEEFMVVGFGTIPASVFDEEYTTFYCDLPEARGIAHFVIAKTSNDGCGFVLGMDVDDDKLALSEHSGKMHETFLIAPNDAGVLNAALRSNVEIIAEYRGMK